MIAAGLILRELRLWEASMELNFGERSGKIIAWERGRVLVRAGRRSRLPVKLLSFDEVRRERSIRKLDLSFSFENTTPTFASHR